MINTLICIILIASTCFFLFSILRPKFKTFVNCWFCNTNQWIPYKQRNSFICKKCDQYNGFDESGDYNKFIPSQRIESLNYNNAYAKRIDITKFPNQNGLCELCNQMQAVVIERLNKFEAVDEKRYFKEYESYKQSLNQKYPLCDECQEYTEQRLQMINEGHLRRPNIPSKKASSLNPFATRCSSSLSQSPSIISESSSFSTSVFSEPQRRPSLIRSRSNSRDPSPFNHRIRAPPKLFPEPITTPSFIRRISNTPSSASGLSFKTIPSRHPSILSKQRIRNHRKLYFASGKTTVACNILNLLSSFVLFISLFDSSQITSNVRILELENYLPMNIIIALHRCTDYGAFIAAFASGILYYGFNNSNTCVNFHDLLATTSWPLFTIFNIFDAKRNPDFNLIKMILAAYLFILSSMILFIPKKLKHQKRANNSAFSVTSTPTSILSSSLTGANQRRHNFSNSSLNLSFELPDPLETWVSSAADHTARKFHNLHI